MSATQIDTEPAPAPPTETAPPPEAAPPPAEAPPSEAAAGDAAQTDAAEKYVSERPPPADHKDVSRQPSYTRFKLPYHLVCHERYNANMRKYEEQFQHEIKHLLEQQSSAYEAMRFQRHLAITSLWPPLHSVRQIQRTLRTFCRLTPKQQERLNYLMNN